MRKTNHFTLSAAILLLATGLPFAGTAGAQPQPPMPPGFGDLHVRITHEAPPPLRHEVRIARPSPHHTWIKGYWHHTGQAWSWMEGRWVEPPQAHAHWVAPSYKRVHGDVRYIPGHWSHEHVIYD
jgi:hypothetical protein